MKLTLLGGGGVRSPFLAKSIAHSAAKGNITEVVFMDNDLEKLDKLGQMACMIGERINPDVRFTRTSDPIEAVRDADFVITTLRVGQDEGRVIDEVIARNHNLLGQETTGAGGFGMALRSVGPLLEYCELVRKYGNEGALIFNFTNPSGIVTQALRDRGYDNVYGICDAPSEFIKQLIEMLDITPERFTISCFGLNHLSWFNDATVDGIDVMEQLLEDERLYTHTEMRLFEPSLVALSGNLFLNEYLYFYYYRDKAINAIREAGETRGELIQRVNAKMQRELKSIEVGDHLEKAFRIFMENYLIRENSYFSIESGQLRPKQLDIPTLDEFINAPDEGGYAGVALNFIRAYVSGEPVDMVLSVPNEGAVPGLDDDDVVEVSCRIEKGAVTPIPVETIEELQMNLIKTVKYYERQTVKAIASKDRDEAVKGLMAHPLINSYELAVMLVDAYLEAHKKYVGVWK